MGFKNITTQNDIHEIAYNYNLPGNLYAHHRMEATATGYASLLAQATGLPSLNPPDFYNNATGRFESLAFYSALHNVTDHLDFGNRGIIIDNAREGISEDQIPLKELLYILSYWQQTVGLTVHAIVSGDRPLPVNHSLIQQPITTQSFKIGHNVGDDTLDKVVYSERIIELINQGKVPKYVIQALAQLPDGGSERAYTLSEVTDTQANQAFAVLRPYTSGIGIVLRAHDAGWISTINSPRSPITLSSRFVIHDFAKEAIKLTEKKLAN
jgi:hypothetical protein